MAAPSARHSAYSRGASEPVASPPPYKAIDPAPSTDTRRSGPATVAARPDADNLAMPKSGSGERTRTVLAGSAVARTKALEEAATSPAANQKCRVWTASYGGQKSIIIRSVADQVVNFTVLDVNMGSEAREAEAFIAAYARTERSRASMRTRPRPSTRRSSSVPRADSPAEPRCRVGSTCALQLSGVAPASETSVSETRRDSCD